MGTDESANDPLASWPESSAPHAQVGGGPGGLGGGAGKGTGDRVGPNAA